MSAWPRRRGRSRPSLWNANGSCQRREVVGAHGRQSLSDKGSAVQPRRIRAARAAPGRFRSVRPALVVVATTAQRFSIEGPSHIARRRITFATQAFCARTSETLRRRDAATDVWKLHETRKSRPTEERKGGRGAGERSMRRGGVICTNFHSGPPDYSSCGKSFCITSLVVATPGNGPR